MTRTFDDETLMAYADGQLDQSRSQEIESAMNDDPGLVERVSVFLETGALAKAAFNEMSGRQVPDALRGNVEAMLRKADQTVSGIPGSVVMDFPKVKSTGKSHSAVANSNWFTAIAASIALLVGGAGGYLVTNGVSDRPAGQIVFGGSPAMSVANALTSVVAGQEISLQGSNTRFRAIASYRDANGDLCREFELDTTANRTFVAIACRNTEEWQMTFAVAADGNKDGYAPASSLDSLEAYLGAVGAGAAMSVEDEAAALKALE